MTINSHSDILQKQCLLGLTYFDVTGKQLKQTLLAGTVISVDEEMGITLHLHANNSTNNEKAKAAQFILPANLSCWFKAPKGNFHTSTEGVKLSDPDYLVTWDIYQSKAQNTKNNDNNHDGEQQWWQWQPRTENPRVA